MPDVVNPQITNDDQGPTEKLRDHTDAAEKDESVPGAQKPEDNEIKGEQNPNTE